MSAYILTSMFPDGLNEAQAEIFRHLMPKRGSFAFIASEFESSFEKTDMYFDRFTAMFAEKGIRFERACVVDGRMTAEAARQAVREADVVWLSGGDSPTEFSYFEKYGLTDIIRQHKGVVIGMSAGSINMAERAICTVTCGHDRQEIYPALGCVPISVEPHFDPASFTDEQAGLSEKYDIYGLCDNAIIAFHDGEAQLYGEIYKLRGGKMEQIKTL